MMAGQPAVADVLSASSLVVAIIAAFLTLWHPETQAALNVEVERDRENREPQRTSVRQALNRVRPLAAIALAALLILVPRAWAVIRTTWGCLVDSTVRSFCTYNEVFALFIVITIVLAGLVCALLAQVHGLLAKRRELDR